MAGEVLPPDLAAILREHERRIANLERAPRLTNSSVTGQLHVYDDAGELVAELGNLDGSGEWGIRVRETETGFGRSVLRVSGRGIVRPWLNSEWVNPADTVSVTSGSFVDAFTSTIELLWTEAIVFRFPANIAVGTTAEFRVVASTYTSGTKSVAGLGGIVSHEFRGLHGLTLGTGPISFSLQARRSAGAGSVAVGPPSNLAHGGDMQPVAGGWV